MDLEFSEEQQMLREMVRGVCGELSPISVVRAMEDDPTGYAPEYWKQLGELGLIGLTIPEAYGGGGQSLLEAAILYEELGRALCPSPHFASGVLAAGALLRAGSAEQQRAWLPRIASGDAIVVPAWLEPKRGQGERGVALEARRDGGAWVLSGAKRHVPFASSAARLLVLARSAQGVELFLVDPQAEGVRLTQQRSLAADTQYRVDLAGVRVAESERLGAPAPAAGTGWAAWDAVMHDAIILAAAQAVGGAARALELTVQYAKDRHQFDKPLGAFQAIAHYLADASTAVDGATTLVYEAAWARAQGRPVERLAPMAKLFACQTFRDVTAMALQVFGGIGFTVEVDIQLYFRRAKQLQLSWWDTHTLETRVADAVLGPLR